MLQVRYAAIAIAALCLSAGIATAQSTSADIIGTVRDSADAVVPNTSLRLVEEKTNYARQASSNPEGIYEFRILVPGTYTLAVEAPGFKKFTSEHIELAARQVLRLDIRL